MNIVSKTRIITEYMRLRAMKPDHESACAAVAHSLVVPIESVIEVTDEKTAECGGDIA